MSDPNISEMQIPPHFTNIQHGLQLARKFLAAQDTPNRQVMLITDGLPTAHFEGEMLYLLYPPDPRTEAGDAARRAAVRPRGHHDQHLPVAELEPDRRKTCTSPIGWRNRRKGRVFFTAGRDLDRYVVWDYVNRRRSIVA